MPLPSIPNAGRRLLGALPITLALLALTATFVHVDALGQQVRRQRTIDVSEITPGMRGYGLTVFQGTTPARFDVEVIDVLHQFRPDQDLILIRVDHPILDAAHVVAGMSGSPIYFDGGRLAGAYAYGWPFSQDPVAGVTPIRNMLTEMRRPITPALFPGATPMPRQPTSARRQARAERLAGLSPYLGAERASASTALDAHAARLGLDQTRPDRGSTLTPAATPILVGGLGPGALDELEAQLGRFGMMVLQAGGAGPATPPPNAPTRYVDGGAIGVQLVRGDIASTAVGTVTHVEGDRLTAFGHPMINAGQTGLPTAICRVLHILSSQSRSFKISEPLRTLGTLVHDRQSSIVADTSLQPAGVDAVVRVNGVEGAPRTEWTFTVASHRVLTPVLLSSAILNALQATVADNADVTVVARSQVWIEGRSAPESVTDVRWSASGVNAGTLRELRLFSLLEAAYGNPFEPSRATRVEVDLDVRLGRDTVRIVDAQVAAREVDPGSMVPVRLVLRHWDEREEVRRIEVPIPERLRGQEVDVTFEAGSEVEPWGPRPRSLDDVLATVHLGYPATSVVVSVETEQRGLRFPGHVAEHLPRSALDALQLANDGDRNRPFITYDRREIPVDAVVSGSVQLELQVRRTPRP